MIVYTCITNGKDNLINVPKEKDVDYICYSDKSFSHPTWQFRPIERLGQKDNRRIARRYKILSHIYFPGKDTIWIDGRIKLNLTVSQIIKKYKSDLCCRLHHSRMCIYDEAKEVIRVRFEDETIVNLQMNKYENIGYPANNGLHETGVLIRRNSYEIEAFNNYWWSQVSTGSKRDQLSFDYCLWELGQDCETIDRKDATVLNHRIRTNLRQ